MDFKIRELRRVAQGRKQLLREREAYSQLMQQGFSNKEACRIVGINEKTGQRWRNGRSAGRHQKAAPPINTVVPPSGPFRYLREDDRIHIADRLREKATVRAIAAELGRRPSTVSREPTCPPTPASTWPPWPPSSTAAHAKRSAGNPSRAPA